MSLDNITSIDIILNETPHAKLTLVIVDGEIHADDEVRCNKLLKKIGCYVAFITSQQFNAQYPEINPNDVLIGVACVQAPSEGMKLITQVRPRGNRESQR